MIGTGEGHCFPWLADGGIAVILAWRTGISGGSPARPSAPANGTAAGFPAKILPWQPKRTHGGRISLSRQRIPARSRQHPLRAVLGAGLSCRNPAVAAYVDARRAYLSAVAEVSWAYSSPPLVFLGVCTFRCSTSAGTFWRVSFDLLFV